MPCCSAHHFFQLCPALPSAERQLTHLPAHAHGRLLALVPSYTAATFPHQELYCALAHIRLQVLTAATRLQKTRGDSFLSADILLLALLHNAPEMVAALEEAGLSKYVSACV